MKNSHNKKKSSVLMTFGNRMLLRRRELGMTQEELAKKAGLQTNYVGQCERGQRNLGIKNVVKLAKALDVPIATLLLSEENK